MQNPNGVPSIAHRGHNIVRNERSKLVISEGCSMLLRCWARVGRSFGVVGVERGGGAMEPQF